MAANGYAWWYLDALSSCHTRGLAIIAFVGSVFSPYYAWARRRGPADPQQHCAINVSVYEAGRKRWAMTERGAAQLHRTADSLRIGPSSLVWEGDHLVVEIDETTAPWPSRLRGRVRLWPRALPTPQHRLDIAGRHRWWPVAPSADVEVELQQPAVRWRGRGYLDSNRGEEPLEDGFMHWHWSRAMLDGGGAAVMYDAVRRDGSAAELALHFGAEGRCRAVPAAPPMASLPTSAWRLARATRSDAGTPATLLRTLEDGPFYARSLVRGRWLGEPVHAMHESLSLDRFRRRVVQAMLPVRMPRRAA